MSVAKVSKYYPAYDEPKPKHHAFKPKTAKLRQSITPGTVLILLAGRFRGKRVVYLKQLASGLLLVTGPYKVNGVPLRRVNQSYVIATSSKVDVSSCLKAVEKVDDKYFSEASDAAKKDHATYHTQTVAKVAVAAGRKDDQKAVDAALLSQLKTNALLKGYLHSRFSLSHGQYPHAMKF